MKRILFVIESLVCAGAEKSLVTLLNLIDYSQYSVDLQLFSYGGEFETMLPAEVNLLPPLPYFSATEEPLKSVLTRKLSAQERRFLQGRLRYSAALRTGKYNNPQKAVLFWRNTHSCFETYEKEYDVAIAYAQGTPTFYVADCVKAKKKFAWVNACYALNGWFQRFAKKKYGAFHKIVCVSDANEEFFQKYFPTLDPYTTVICDINDGALIERMSGMESSAATDMAGDGYKILTIGRLAVQKGYDIALEACRILRDRGIQFTWYVLGRGTLEEEIRMSIKEKDIEKYFVLLGTRANPYPYIKQADVYVQTSRFEGFGLAIAEARMLNTPVVTTRFDAVYAQMIEGENGLVTDVNAQAVADGIQRLLDDKELYDHIVAFQKTEKKGNYEEIRKFYTLIEA